MPLAAQLTEARLMASRGELDTALAAVAALLERRPDAVEALLLKAALLLEAREEDLSLAAYLQAVERDPDSAEALNGAARCLHAAGRDSEALELAERARARLELGDNYVQTGPVYLTLLWCLREQRRFREAVALAQEGLRRCDDAVLAHWAATVEEEQLEAERERC